MQTFGKYLKNTDIKRMAPWKQQGSINDSLKFYANGAWGVNETIVHYWAILNEKGI